MSDINSDLVAQEVDDEVRRERMNLLWKTYGKYIVGIAVGIVLVVAGREAYSWRVKTVESANSVAFAEALTAAEAEGADAAAIWRGVGTELGAGYGVLAKLRLAGAETAAGRYQEALAAYDEIAGNSEYDTTLRDLAALKAGMLLAGKVGDLDAAKSRLDAIATGGNAWYFSAQEQLALIDLQQQANEEALLKFTLLADATETPTSIRTRASQFRDFLEAKQFAAAGTKSAATDATDDKESAGTATEGDGL